MNGYRFPTVTLVRSLADAHVQMSQGHLQDNASVDFTPLEPYFREDEFRFTFYQDRSEATNYRPVPVLEYFKTFFEGASSGRHRGIRQRCSKGSQKMYF